MTVALIGASLPSAQEKLLAQAFNDVTLMLDQPRFSASGFTG
jgi:hypothetical protein